MHDRDSEVNGQGFMRIALTNLAIDKLIIVTPGERSYPLEDRIEILQLKDAIAHSKK